MTAQTKRVQTRLTANEYAALIETANQRDQSVSAVIREALVSICGESPAIQAKVDAAERLCALNLPSAD